MQEKHKVTLYLPPDLHRQLKIRAAVDAEAMSAIAQRALIFYLNHSEIVDEVEAVHGRTHQVYSCPECATPLVVRDGEAIALGQQSAILDDDLSAIDHTSDQSGEQALVPV
ncbi:MAG: hypothetical protein HC895_01685 [Leptolyngbyaceae cyanobacterium SM1_3_5]|nr:hypothetical protein [Leptolyngbyaceae cyanobacterium SM1_3_5]